MAALVLSFAGSALGGAFGAAGAVAGRLVGAVAGAVLDRALFGPRPPDGPRLKDLDVLSSTEGTPIPRLYGRARVAGQIIWATRLEEHPQGGGKGGSPRTYSYTANFAVGLCEGPIACIRRIWADGKELDQRGLALRVHLGTEEQEADPLIVAKQGDTGTPAYRGLAYVVFERLNLENFGNRIPQLTFEVVRPIGELEKQVRAMVLIPGSTEFGYEPDIYVRDFGLGRTGPETRHTTLDASNFTASLDELQALCPNLERVALVVAWFGTDLRIGECEVRPSIEGRGKVVAGLTWIASNETTETARLVTQIDGKPAYGGSPSDATVIRALQDMAARGLAVTFIPFIMMDIPADNDLPNPRTGAPGQPPYPWRGRITSDPAPGRPGSPHGTGAAGAQVAAFLGSAAPGDFTTVGDAITYDGPEEWSYRRFVLHMAHLAAAGGVESFLIGSEMIGSSQIRDGSGHPFVQGLVTLADEVSAILPEAKIAYAADWTEYGGHTEGDDLFFPLDPLWASPHIDAVGIDWYAPIDDLRDGGEDSPYDRPRLAAAFSSGEGYDWYYADEDARLAGTRTPITDGLGKPWVHRQKDIWAWWAGEHLPRTAGVEGSATGWVPRSKPIWLTELGYPAVDKGTNRPSVFPDPKSIESGLPPFSTGARDDLMQRRALEAALGRFDPALGASLSDNPVSPLYGGRMMDVSRTALWAWDARPWPAFPRAADVWSDGGNWRTGHWLTGRLGGAPVPDLIRFVLAEYGITDVDVEGVEGTLDGAIIDRPMSARDALEPIARVFGVDIRERGETLVFTSRARPSAATLSREDLVEPDEAAPLSVTRRGAGELPVELSVAFTETEADYRSSAVTTRRLEGEGRRVSSLAIAAAAEAGEMTGRAETLLHRLWAEREQAAFALPPSRLALEPGDVVTLAEAGRLAPVRLTQLEGTLMRKAEALSHVTGPRPAPVAPPPRPLPVPPAEGKPAVMLLDLPPLGEADPPVLLHAAVAAHPWRGPYTIWRGGEGLGDEQVATMALPSLMGRTTTDLADGRPWLWDRSAGVTVELVTGTLSALPEVQVLGGANSLVIRTGGGWEVLQFRDAELVAERTYRLSHLLRGQRGTEHRIAAVPAGADIVVLNGPLAALGTSPDLIGRPFRYRVGSAVLLAGDPAMAELEATMTDTALKPLAPVRLMARREAGGIRFSWVRRTRFGGDGWELADIPLGEASERYRLKVLSGGGTVLRSIDVTTPEYLYPNAAETTDFGAPQAAIRFAVAQLSLLADAGTPAEATITL